MVKCCVSLCKKFLKFLLDLFFWYQLISYWLDSKLLEFDWSWHSCSYMCCERRAFSVWRSWRYGVNALCFKSKFTATSLTFQGSLLTCNDKCLVFVVRDLLKVGYLSQVLCEFMQEIFVDVLDLFFLVPTYFLLVGFKRAQI